MKTESIKESRKEFHDNGVFFTPPALASELYRIHRSTFVDVDICDLCERVEKGKKI